MSCSGSLELLALERIFIQLLVLHMQSMLIFIVCGSLLLKLLNDCKHNTSVVQNLFGHFKKKILHLPQDLHN